MTLPTNLPASVKARLLNLAQSRNETFNDLVVRYCIERLLYRLGQSKHADRFLLKGAMLFALWDDRMPRPTKDVDFLGFGRMEVESIADSFREVIRTPATPDGLEFPSETVTAEEIREGQAYGGIRVHLIAYLGKAGLPCAQRSRRTATGISQSHGRITKLHRTCARTPHSEMAGRIRMALR